MEAAGVVARDEGADRTIMAHQITTSLGKA